MTSTAASLLLPLVRDMINERWDLFFFGCLAGACDVLQKTGHLTHVDYDHITRLADTSPQSLLALLAEESFSPDSRQGPNKRTIGDFYHRVTPWSANAQPQ